MLERYPTDRLRGRCAYLGHPWTRPQADAIDLTQTSARPRGRGSRFAFIGWEERGDGDGSMPFFLIVINGNDDNLPGTGNMAISGSHGDGSKFGKSQWMVN